MGVLGHDHVPAVEEKCVGSTNSTGHRELLDTSGALLADVKLRRDPILQGGQDVQECHAEHRGPRGSSFSKNSVSQLEADRKYGCAPFTAWNENSRSFLRIYSCFKITHDGVCGRQGGACKQQAVVTQCRRSKCDGWRRTHSD